MNILKRLEYLGINVPEILIPADCPEKWSVIACDQFSSECAYWAETRNIVGSFPSTLDLIIPECYLEEPDQKKRVEDINANMQNFLKGGVLRSLSPGFVLVERSTPFTSHRRGLVLAVDLEAYDFSPESKSLIRPTEGTIHDRLPPRMHIRRGASLDLPHILLLIDDPEDTVMQAAASSVKEKIYDFDLMQEGGHVTGYFFDVLEPVITALESLKQKSDLLFAVGDGNHSLASAREIWLEKKAEGAPENDPARFALVEVENIHDPGLHFHPIHRVLFGLEPNKLLRQLRMEFGTSSSGEEIQILTADAQITLQISVEPGRLAVEPIQAFLDAFLSENPSVSMDYIHGQKSVKSLVSGYSDRVGILFPEINTRQFFRRIANIGPYPRKSFSIGEAVEKRYYLESRRLKL